MPPKELTPEEKITALEKENTDLKKSNTDLVGENKSLTQMVTELQEKIEDQEKKIAQIKDASKKAGVRPLLDFDGKSLRFTVASFFFAKKDGETEKITSEDIENDFMSDDKKKKAAATELLKTIVDKKLGVIEILSK